ncbi:LytTR family DNA-binding domain-containing protein [Muricauda sp. 334s03]|uniref:LytTR family DNA-binding domain-containing protein n=1 Tax=Flagellimonas yonaguniensis TaxID=3031325 RepID=A0ABT5Y4C9_9FLAO|nr:LytTR family DNA-binding domain-containing protein [[Muricauda] yonaguniensis]MDF0718308.1 LytTR family DNA-binding domain-containing protein [[Muricauda] yonaguniensis]
MTANNNIIVIPEGNKRHFFKIHDIDWIQADKYYVHIYSAKGRALLRITLKKLMELLPSNFVRTNRSTLVNVNSIRMITKNKVNSTVTLTNDMEISISNHYCEDLEELLLV